MKKKRPRVSRPKAEENINFDASFDVLDEGNDRHILSPTKITEIEIMLKSMTSDELKAYQAKCQHLKGYITNTGMNSPSTCVECGKPWN